MLQQELRSQQRSLLSFSAAEIAIRSRPRESRYSYMIYFGLKVLSICNGYFGGQVSDIWVLGPSGRDL